MNVQYLQVSRSIGRWIDWIASKGKPQRWARCSMRSRREDGGYCAPAKPDRPAPASAEVRDGRQIDFRAIVISAFRFWRNMLRMAA